MDETELQSVDKPILVHAVNVSIEYTASNHWVSVVHGLVVQKPINVNPQLKGN